MSSYLYCNIITFAYLQKLVYVDEENNKFITLGEYQTAEIANAIVINAKKEKVNLIVLEGNTAYLEKVKKEIQFLDNKLKVEVNPDHNEISY